MSGKGGACATGDNDSCDQWTEFTKDGKPQTLKGAYAVNKDSLALEPDAGGTMLAQVSFVNPDEFLFTMVGSDPKQPGLDFKK